MAKRKVYENLSHTPQFGPGYNIFSALGALWSRSKEAIPRIELPSIKQDLQHFHSEKPAIIWFGHSSYLIHANGVNILVDPVLSGYASFLSFQFRAFKGADIYKVADMPQLDYILLTHNHYDHLDYNAIRSLAARTNAFVTPLDVSKTIKHLATKEARITELNWWQSLQLADNIKITSTPARHFSGRSLRRNGSLWTSYVLEIDRYKIFIGGDSGYDSHFKSIGDKFGPFDIALLECGQYNKMWPYIHSMPEELIAEGYDLQAKVIMPVHWAKFALALHPWHEPIQRFVAAADNAGIQYTTPMIGEPVILNEQYPQSKWWEQLL